MLAVYCKLGKDHVSVAQFLYQIKVVDICLETGCETGVVRVGWTAYAGCSWSFLRCHFAAFWLVLRDESLPELLWCPVAVATWRTWRTDPISIISQGAKSVLKLSTPLMTAGRMVL